MLFGVMGVPGVFRQSGFPAETGVSMLSKLYYYQGQSLSYLLPHGQLYGRFPVCILRCLARLEDFRRVSLDQ